MKSFVSGLMSPLRGLTYLMKNPGLSAYIVIPAAINAVLTFLFLILTFLYGSGWIAGLLDRFLPETGWARTLLLVPAWLLAVAVVLLAAGVIFVIVSKILAGPFNDMLSGQVEMREGFNAQAPSTISQAAAMFGRGMANEVMKLAFYLVVIVVVFPLNIIPLLGSALYAVLWTGFSLWFLGMENIDFPMARRNWRFSEKLAYWKSEAPLLTGIGAGSALVLLVPVVNFVLMPLVVIGATLCFLERRPPEERPATPPAEPAAGTGS